jgi:hypothetical protein
MESLKKRKQSDKLGIDARIILKIDFREMGLEGVDCIHAAHDRDWL